MRSHVPVILVPIAVLLHQAGSLPIPVVPVLVLGTHDVPGHSIDPFNSAGSSTNCRQTVDQWHAWVWGLMFTVAVGLVLLTGLLAGLTLAVLSVDLPRLMVWTRTGSANRRLIFLPDFARMRLTVECQKACTDDSGSAEPSELATGISDLVVGDGSRGATLDTFPSVPTWILGRICHFDTLRCGYWRNPPTGNYASVRTRIRGTNDVVREAADVANGDSGGFICLSFEVI